MAKSKLSIVNADIIEWSESYRGPKFHALLCDAPYEMAFMNKSWDSSGIVFNPDTWRVLAEHLLPGAFLFVFAGTLNDDLISVAMRQAGLRKFHKTINWAFGSGFPKASNIAVQIDKKNGLIKHRGKAFVTAGHGERKDIVGTHGLQNGIYKSPKHPSAKIWVGHRYGLQALKPAAETILIFQKPYDGKPVDSIVRNGSGALNVDAGRIKTSENLNGGGYSGGNHKGNSLGFTGKDGRKSASKRLNQEDFVQPQGRWPANLILQHSPDCNGTCSPECAVAEMDEQSGILLGAGNKVGTLKKSGSFFTDGKSQINLKYDNGGTASRFFFNADWNYEAEERIVNEDAVRYQAKAGRKERDAGLNGVAKHNKRVQYGDGFNSATKVRTLKQKENGVDRGECKNNHPTVKPIALCKYLATLLLPPAEYAPRQILIPFAGVMSEAIGAMLAGWEEIVAIEKEKEYCDIGKARVKYWQAHKEPEKKIKPLSKTKEPKLQLELV